MKNTAIISRACVVTVILCYAMQVFASDEPGNAENILWSVVEKKKTLSAYDSFLLQYAEGKLATQARTARKKIIDKQLAQEEQSAWQSVQDSEIIQKVEEFLAKFPGGAYASIATARISSLHKIETEFHPGQTFKGCYNCPEMMIVPSGSFTMGEGPNGHTVTFSAPFAISKKEITQQEWLAVMGSNPSKFKDCSGDCPLNNVSWYDAQEFIRRLNSKTGKEYRLPTESEWEYACHAGTQQVFCGSNDADSVAWYGVYSAAGADAIRASHPVSSKKANAWGIFDMSGNVAEWTEDGYHASFTDAPADGSAWQGKGRGYILRGGSWEKNQDQVSSFSREYDAPENGDITYGFRVARKFP